MLAAGSLTKTVRFVRPALMDGDGAGGGTVTWAAFATVRASVKWERGRERLHAGRLASEQGGTVLVRASGATRQATTADFIDIDGQACPIRGVAEIGRGRALEFTVERGVAV